MSSTFQSLLKKIAFPIKQMIPIKSHHITLHKYFALTKLKTSCYIQTDDLIQGDRIFNDLSRCIWKCKLDSYITDRWLWKNHKSFTVCTITLKSLLLNKHKIARFFSVHLSFSENMAKCAYLKSNEKN